MEQACTLHHFNGQLVVFSTQERLLPGDTDYWSDIYGWDREHHQIVQFSVRSDGNQGIAKGEYAKVSTDGRYVVMAIDGALDPTDTNNQYDIYRHDRVSGLTERVTQYTDRAYGAYDFAISGDGNLIAYSLSLPISAEIRSYVEVRNMTTGTIQRIGDETGQPLPHIVSPLMAADGARVAFLVRGVGSVDCGDVYDIYLGSPGTGHSERVVQGTPDAFVHGVMLTADGEMLTYLVTSTQGTRLMARHSDGSTETLIENWRHYSCSTNRDYALSADGRWVAFSNYDLPENGADTNAAFDVYRYDRWYDHLRRVSVVNGEEGQAQANGSSTNPVLSADGRTVIFFSRAGNLPNGGKNPPLDFERIFVWGQ